MAKNNGRIYKIIGIVLVIVGMFAGVVITWGGYGKDIESNAKDIRTLGIDGCSPAKETKGSMPLIEYRLDAIDIKQQEFSTKQETMRKENETSFKKILERLPK